MSKSKGVNPVKGGSGVTKVLGIAVLVVVGYLVITDPTGSAEAARSGASSISTFVGELRGGGQS